jgi:ribonuclease P/MRP protein subunit RPP40
LGSSAWFVLSASALDKQAVEGRDGYTIAAAPDIISEQAGDAGASTKRYAISWEFVGASATES